MIAVVDKTQCCGCEACACACPTKCIDLIEDNEGFLYPFVREPQCIECGTCEKVCPVLNSIPDTPITQHGYIVQSLDQTLLFDSTSGGAFTEIARSVFQEGGVVFGVALDVAGMPRHSFAVCEDDLAGMRGSKYAQSAIGKSFTQVKEFLDAGRSVLFSGTPCQVEGLLSFLGEKPSKLLLVDIVCHSVPSPLVWRRYLEMQREKLKCKVHNIKFRDKRPYGYQYSQMSLYDEFEKRHYCEGVETDPFLRAFFSEICNRPICHACPFKKRYRVSDITIWDCWNAEELDSRFDSNVGTSKVLTHTKRGFETVESISSTSLLAHIEPDALCEGERELLHSTIPNPKRGQFLFDCANEKNASILFGKWFPQTMRTRAEKAVRRLLARTGISFRAKSMLKNVLGKARR